MEHLGWVASLRYHPAYGSRRGGGVHLLSRYAKDRTERAREGLVAELGSCFLCADLGLSPELEPRPDHARYLGSWLKVLGDDKRRYSPLRHMRSVPWDFCIVSSRRPRKNARSPDASPFVVLPGTAGAPIQLRALSLGLHIGLHADDGARRDRPYFGLHDFDCLEGLQHARLDHRVAVVGKAEGLLPSPGCCCVRSCQRCRSERAMVARSRRGCSKCLLGLTSNAVAPFGRSARVRSTGWPCHVCLRPAKANDYPFHACDRPPDPRGSMRHV